MNKEEIKEALEIIRQPITVNSQEYHYFDQENYNKLFSVYDNCQWFINNVEQIMDNCKDLQQKVNQLETNIEEAIEYIKNNIQEGYSEVYEAYIRWDAVSGDDLLSILERGKE